MSDIANLEWVKELRKLLGLPMPGERQWINGDPKELLGKLDRQEQDGLSLPVLQQMQINASSVQLGQSEGDTAAQRALDELAKLFSELRGEGMGLLKVVDDPELSPGEREEAINRLGEIHDTLAEKYDHVRKLVG